MPDQSGSDSASASAETSPFTPPGVYSPASRDAQIAQTRRDMRRAKWSILAVVLISIPAAVLLVVLGIAVALLTVCFPVVQ